MPSKDKLTHLWELLQLFNEWEEVQDVLEKTFGCGLHFINASGQGVLERQYTSPICHLVLNSKIGYQRCLDSYCQRCFVENVVDRRDENSEGISIFRCHAGLTNFSTPIIIHQENHIIMVVGSMLLDEVDEKWCREYALELEIDSSVFLEAIKNAKHLPAKEVIYTDRIIKLLVEPLKEDILRYYSFLEESASLLEIMDKRHPGELSIPKEPITSEEFIRQTEQRVVQSEMIASQRVSDKRCVITGLGVISSIGIGKEEFLSGLLHASSGVSHISLFDTSLLPVKIAGEVKGFDPLSYMDRKQVKRTDRTTQFAITAANMALKDAELDLSKEDVERIGVIIGAGMGGLGFGEEQHLKFIKEGPQKVSPFLSVIMFAGACSSAVSLELGVKGPSITISTGCAAGTDAIGYAFERIQNGESKIMIAGGAEAPIRPLILTSFYAMGALSSRNDAPEKASRPFDARRDGFIMGEGAGIVILEELEHALNRGAHIYAELVGYSSTGDAYHMVAPDPTGEQAARAMELAIKDAGLNPEDIEYVNVHGSSTPLNDKTETMVIKNVFGPYASNLAISSTKSMVGHSIGASGGIELIATLLGMENNFLPPTINQEHPDPECDLDCVPNKPREARINIAMSNSFGFGGKNSVLVVRRYPDDKC